MHAFEDRYGEQIPEVRGDFTPYWEDGAASSARETAMTRNGRRNDWCKPRRCGPCWLRHKYPADEFYAAWRDVLLYNEHTWGAHCSISQPDSPFTLSQWKIKQAFAVGRATPIERPAASCAVPQVRVRRTQVDAVDVWNTTSWARIGPGPSETDSPLVGYVVKDLRGQRGAVAR